MKLGDFVRERQPRWERLEQLISAAKRKVERLGPGGVREMGSLYRSTAADLATARHRFPGDPTIIRLETLVTNARSLIYERAGRRRNLVTFFADDYWTTLWERRRQLGLAGILLLLPALLGSIWASQEPATVIELVPPDFTWVAEATTTDTGLGGLGLTGFSTFVLVNNVRVALTAFALGVTWGLGTGFVLVQNGFILGQVGGLAVEAGNTKILTAALIAHGVLELSCIVVAGAAGLSLGKAMLRPGRKTRREALGHEAVAAFKIAGGTAAWLVLAGFIEGFASRQGFGWIPTTIIGLTVGAIFWGLLWWRGRRSVIGHQSSVISLRPEA